MNVCMCVSIINTQNIAKLPPYPTLKTHWTCIQCCCIIHSSSSNPTHSLWYQIEHKSQHIQSSSFSDLEQIPQIPHKSCLSAMSSDVFFFQIFCAVLFSYQMIQFSLSVLHFWCQHQNVHFDWESVNFVIKMKLISLSNIDNLF